MKGGLRIETYNNKYYQDVKKIYYHNFSFYAGLEYNLSYLRLHLNSYGKTFIGLIFLLYVLTITQLLKYLQIIELNYINIAFVSLTFCLFYFLYTQYFYSIAYHSLVNWFLDYLFTKSDMQNIQKGFLESDLSHFWIVLNDKNELCGFVAVSPV